MVYSVDQKTVDRGSRGVDPRGFGSAVVSDVPLCG